MSESETARLLSPATNFAVVQLPGRKFPGVVFQGDSLHTLCAIARRVSLRLEGSEDQELIDDVSRLAEGLLGPLHHYKEILREKGLTAPF